MKRARPTHDPFAGALVETDASDASPAPISAVRSSRGRSPMSAVTVGPEHELSAGAREYRALAEPERDLLAAVFEGPTADKLARAPGGWRTLSGHELDELGLTKAEKERVEALQILVQRSFAPLPKRLLHNSAAVAAFYGPRLAGHTREVFIAAALNGLNEITASVEIAAGAPHHVSVLPRQVLAAMLRAGASAFVVVHNHPSGDATPSAEDVAVTRALVEAGKCMGVPLADHVIIASRTRGYTSLLDLRVIAAEPQPGGDR